MDHDSFTNHRHSSNSQPTSNSNINSQSTSVFRSRSIFSSSGFLRLRRLTHSHGRQSSLVSDNSPAATIRPNSPDPNASANMRPQRRSGLSLLALRSRVSQFSSSLLSSILPDRRHNSPASTSSVLVTPTITTTSDTNSISPIHSNSWSDASSRHYLTTTQSQSSSRSYLEPSEFLDLDDFSQHQDSTPPQYTSSRRGDSHTTEDQATILAQLLAVAATATAISLVDNSQLISNNPTGRTIFGNSSHLNNSIPNERETTFTGFLSSLRTGLLASDLSSSFNNDSSISGRGATTNNETLSNRPVNFFRMFRFTPSSSEPNQVPILMVGVRPVESRSQSPIQAAFSDFAGNHTNSRRNLFMRNDSIIGDDLSNDSNNESDDESIIFRNTDQFQDSNTEGISDNIEEPPRQSWVIFVLGGTYPTDHPILLVPSLFSDNPSYEDLMLLESYMGQVKPPVATAADVERSGGVFTVGAGSEFEPPGEEDCRCLICLSNYVPGDECRKLNDCKHTFHRECIDEWLIHGRNSCPLCRREGVKSSTEEDSSTTATAESTMETSLPNMMAL